MPFQESIGKVARRNPVRRLLSATLLYAHLKEAIDRLLSSEK